MSRGGAARSIVAMNRNDIDDTLRDMWVTRPRRYDRDKKIAGVAAAIARRYQIDPTLVRVAFVVATFYGGAGILLYLLGWLLLPAGHDEVSPAEAALGRGRSSMSTALVVVLAIVLIPASIGFFSNGGPSVLLSIAVIGAGLFLLHRQRGSLGSPYPPGALPGTPFGTSPGTPLGTPLGTMAAPGVPPPTQATPGAGAGQAATTVPFGAMPAGPAAPGTDPATATQRPTDRVPDSQPEQRPNPPAWDPLGVAPFAWDLPEPSQPLPPAPAPKRRSPVTPVTIGLALVTAGVGAFAAMYDSYLDGPRVVAMVLAVVGAGLVVGSFVRGGRGLIPIAIPLAAITWGLAVVPNANFSNMGDVRFAPSRVTDVQPRYEHGAGNFELDLTRMQVPENETVHTRVELGFGNMEVLVPRGADVEATCSSDFGNVECLGRNDSGPNTSQSVEDFGDDGAGSGGKFELVLVNTGAGNVELRRG